MTDEHFARRYLLNDTNTTAPPATEAVFFEYTIVSRFTPGITIFANIAFVMFCLKQLLHMATAQIDEFPEYRFVKDKFQSREEGQNWNYDFVIVTSIKDEGHKFVDDLQRKNSMLGTFGDYRDLVLIYGYTVLFVAALPLAPLLALINAYAQIRVDAWNISVVSRRPWPQNAEDIGSWADIIELLSYIAVFTNSIIITYTGEFLTHWTNANRIITFAFLYHGMVVAKQLAALVIEDVPGDVQIQIDRQEFVEKKLIFCAADDQMEVPGVAEDGDAPDVTIFDKDDSVVYLDYPGYENYGKERKREISDSVRSRKKQDEGYSRQAELTSL